MKETFYNLIFVFLQLRIRDLAYLYYYVGSYKILLKRIKKAIKNENSRRIEILLEVYNNKYIEYHKKGSLGLSFIYTELMRDINSEIILLSIKYGSNKDYNTILNFMKEAFAYNKIDYLYTYVINLKYCRNHYKITKVLKCLYDYLEYKLLVTMLIISIACNNYYLTKLIVKHIIKYKLYDSSLKKLIIVVYETCVNKQLIDSSNYFIYICFILDNQNLKAKENCIVC
jgi:hypothetical protein